MGEEDSVGARREQQRCVGFLLGGCQCEGSRADFETTVMRSVPKYGIASIRCHRIQFVHRFRRRVKCTTFRLFQRDLGVIRPEGNERVFGIPLLFLRVDRGVNFRASNSDRSILARRSSYSKRCSTSGVWQRSSFIITVRRRPQTRFMALFFLHHPQATAVKVVVNMAPVDIVSLLELFSNRERRHFDVPRDDKRFHVAHEVGSKSNCQTVRVDSPPCLRDARGSLLLFEENVVAHGCLGSTTTVLS